jgi:hypothetical protein
VVEETGVKLTVLALEGRRVARVGLARCQLELVPVPAMIQPRQQVAVAIEAAVVPAVETAE